MDFYNFPDTLVFKITKYAYDVNHFMYIVYDNSLDKYIIRGQKLNKQPYKATNYSFECESTTYLRDFMMTVLGNKSNVSYSFYNYDNLPLTSDEITYDLLEDYDDKIYELSNEITILKKKQLKHYLNMLTHILNDNQ